MTQRLGESLSDSRQRCYKYLNETSRGYDIIIQTLDAELSHAMCIFYLVLRALDTIEDDLTISVETKIPMLCNLHSYLYQPDWKFMESKSKDKQVLEDFPTISLEFRNLAKVYRDVIVDICQKMGHGMAEFLEKKVDSVQEWEKYSFYVVGLVGLGLSRIFVAFNLVDSSLVEDKKDSIISMGVFVEKINVIQDYLEDQSEGREFWPKEVWSKYVKKSSDLAKPENIDKAVQCMNELITNALHHLPEFLHVLALFKHPTVFSVTALIVLKSVATMAACYNNKKVFSGLVDIRKGEAVTLIMDATNMQAVKAIVHHYMEEIYRKIPSTDPSASKTREIVLTIQSLSKPDGALVSRVRYTPIYLSGALLLAALSWQYLSIYSKATEEYVQTGEN